MAIQNGNFLSGLVGTVVMYSRNGKQCMRGKALPGSMKQTKPTKIAAKQFGVSSSMSMRLRFGMTPLLQDIKQDKMMYRVNTVLRQWLQSGAPGAATAKDGYSFIDHFQFNEKTSLDEKLILPLTLDWTKKGKLIIHIPALTPSQNIAAPRNTDTVHWMFGVDSCKLEVQSKGCEYYTSSFDMKYDNTLLAATKIELNFKTKPGELNIAALALRYTVTKQGKPVLLNDEKWMPAGIIGSLYKKK